MRASVWKKVNKLRYERYAAASNPWLSLTCSQWGKGAFLCPQLPYRIPEVFLWAANPICLGPAMTSHNAIHCIVRFHLGLIEGILNTQYNSNVMTMFSTITSRYGDALVSLNPLQRVADCPMEAVEPLQPQSTRSVQFRSSFNEWHHEGRCLKRLRWTQIKITQVATSAELCLGSNMDSPP